MEGYKTIYAGIFYNSVKVTKSYNPTHRLLLHKDTKVSSFQSRYNFLWFLFDEAYSISFGPWGHICPPQTVTYLEPLRNVLGIVTFRLFICLFIISVEESMESVDNPLHEAAKRGNVGFLQECLNNKVNCPTCSFVVHFPLCN